MQFLIDHLSSPTVAGLDLSSASVRKILLLMSLPLLYYFIDRSREKDRDQHGMGLKEHSLPSAHAESYAAALGIDNATTRRLKAARALLPTPLKEHPQIPQGSLERLEEHLAQKRPQLALAELEGLGNSNPCPPAFWHELAEAAGEMWLSDRAANFREKATQPQFDIT